eukprot:3425178-Rhodomonas_salina.1
MRLYMLLEKAAAAHEQQKNRAKQSLLRAGVLRSSRENEQLHNQQGDSTEMHNIEEKLFRASIFIALSIDMICHAFDNAVFHASSSFPDAASACAAAAAKYVHFKGGRREAVLRFVTFLEVNVAGFEREQMAYADVDEWGCETEPAGALNGIVSTIHVYLLRRMEAEWGLQAANGAAGKGMVTTFAAIVMGPRAPPVPQCGIPVVDAVWGALSGNVWRMWAGRSSPQTPPPATMCLQFCQQRGGGGFRSQYPMHKRRRTQVDSG